MKKKTLFTSFLTIVMCLCLTVGATFALFTSSSEVDISVTSGTVDVKATVDTLKYKSLNDADYLDFNNGTSTTFEVGGTASVDGGKVTLSRIVPGDAVSFNVQVTNYSDVIVKYRTVIKNAQNSDEDLYSALSIKVNGYKFNGLVSTPWTKLDAVTAPTSIVTIPVSIELPANVDGAQYMGKTVAINVLVEAIQGNAETKDEIVITKDVEVSGGAITENSAIDTDVAKAEVSAGTKLNDGESTLTLTVTEANDGINTGIHAILNPDKATALTVKIPEVASDNQELIKVTLKGAATQNLDVLDLRVYHSGAPMTSVASVNALVKDSFYYDATTGDITIAIVNFSNFTIVEGGELQEYAIANLNGLKYFRDLVNGGKNFSGKTVKLTADIDLSGENWTPIGPTSGICFAGTFDGDGHAIKNLTVIQNRGYGNGFFANLVSATVKNLTIDGAHVSRYDFDAFSGNAYGILSGYAYGKCAIENVHVVNSKIVGFGKVGGIIGMTGGDCVPSTMSNCSVKNTKIYGTYNVGGLLGLQNGGDTVTYTGCAVDGVTFYTDSASYYVANGGVYWDYNDEWAYAGLGAVYTDYIDWTNGSQGMAGYVHNEANGVSVSNVIFNIDGEELIYKTETVQEDGVKVTEYNLTGKVLASFSEEVKSEVSIPEGVTHLGSKSLQGDTTVKEVVLPSTVVDFGGTPNAQGTGASGGMFYQSAVEKVTLPEGLTEIPAATFNQASALKEVNIPSSVTKIGINAFAGSGLTSLSLGSQVKEIGYGAFRDMANLEEITIDGDVYIPTYAFRACASLKKVYLNGDNVTFGSGMIFTVTSTNNENPNGITVYVQNEVVKSRLLANGQFKGEIVVVNDTTNGYYEKEDGSAVVFDNSSLSSALNDGETTINLFEGTYVIPNSAQGKNVKFVGVGDVKIATNNDTGSYEGCNYALDGATAEFVNVTINTPSTTYIGYARAKVTFTDCTFNGTYTLYDDTVFNNCVFNVSGDVYNIWTWGAPKATFNNCTFNSDGKAILLYSTVSTTLNVNECIFNDNGGLEDKKAAIEIGNDYGVSYVVNVTNTTVNGYEINDKGINTNTTLWGNKNSMGTDKLNVVVDGVDVY